eukprot:sb/3465616/
MFARHDVVDIVSKRLNNQRLCTIHNEPFIMYNAEDKSLLCISCFREIGLSKRSHCLDIESAYSTVQGALGKSIEYTRGTLGSLSDLLAEIKALIAHTKDLSDKRSEDISSTYSSIIQAAEVCRDRLSAENREFSDRTLQSLRDKHTALECLLPILQNNLHAADLFQGLSDRFDLVELGTYVIERLQSLTGKLTQLQSIQTTTDDLVDCRKDFTECLGLTLADKKLPNADKLHDSIRAELIAYHRGISRSAGPGSMYSKQLEHEAVRIDELQRCLNTYKDQVQELHRDITIRKSSAGASKTPELTKSCELLLSSITAETNELKQLQPLLETSWKETLNSVVKQQREIERKRERESERDREGWRKREKYVYCVLCVRTENASVTF